MTAAPESTHVNLDAERGVLGSFIKNPSWEIFGQAFKRGIKPATFSTVAHQRIFESYLRLQKNGKPIESIAIAEYLANAGHLELVGGKDYLNELADKGGAVAHALGWIEIIREKAMCRDLLALCRQTAELVNAGNLAAPLVEQFQQDILSLTHAMLPDPVVHGSVATQEAMASFPHIFRRKSITGVRTGIDFLDNTTGGLQPGQVMLVAVPPHLGKTSLAIQLTEAALFGNTRNEGKRVPVLLFSLEMERRDIALSLIALRAGLNLSKLIAGFVTRDALNEMASVEAEFRDMPLFIDDTGDQTIREIYAKSRRTHAQHQLGMIIIDCIQLIQGTDSSVSREQHFAQVLSVIKDMAREFGIPVVVFSSLERNPDIVSADAFRINCVPDVPFSHAADMVLFLALTREADANGEEIDVDRCRTERTLILAKNKFGSTGVWPILFNRSLCKYEDRRSLLS